MKLSDDNPTLNHHLYCLSCGQLFREPMRLSCGHTFCAECSHPPNDICLHCEKRILPKRTQRDILAGRLVAELKVECSNSNCPWKGILQDFKFHAEKCELKSGLENFLSRLDTMKQQTDKVVKTLSLGEMNQLPSGQPTSQKKDSNKGSSEKQNHEINNDLPEDTKPSEQSLPAVVSLLPEAKQDRSWLLDDTPSIKPENPSM